MIHNLHNVQRCSIRTLIENQLVRTVTPTFKLQKQQYKKFGQIPIISQEIEYVSGYCNTIDNAIPAAEYICFGDHSEHIKYVDFSFVQGADGLKIMITDKAKLLPRYFYHAILNFYIRHNNYERHFKYLQDTIIPIPPLPVQEEIVHILDTFTELTSELTSELTARRKQYEYYRDRMFTFDENHPFAERLKEMCPNGVERKLVSDVCDSLQKGTLKTEQLNPKGYPVINSGRTIYGRYSKYNNDGNAFTVASRGEYAGFVTFMEEPFWAGGLCYPYRSVNEQLVITKYIYHFLKANETKIMGSLVSRGSIPALNKIDIDNFKVPIPPLSIQEEIVRILDQFESLCNDITSGMPAEIEARQKQYEYYRDRLLSFKDVNR